MEAKTEKLDEKGFVFIDGHGRPYWCAIYHGTPMFMYWHEAQKSWVTLRQVNQTDIWNARKYKIKDKMAKYYHDLHEKFINGI